jgi:hypothetical protein
MDNSTTTASVIIDFLLFIIQTLQTMKNFQEALEAGLIPALDYIIRDERVSQSIKLAAAEHKYAAGLAEAVKNSVVDNEGVMPFEQRPIATQEALNKAKEQEDAAWDWLQKFVRYSPEVN